MVSYLLLGVAFLIAALFGVGGGWGFYGVGGIGLAICVVGVLIAAFFLLLDFEAISQGIRNGAPERESGAWPSPPRHPHLALPGVPAPAGHLQPQLARARSTPWPVPHDAGGPRRVRSVEDAPATAVAGRPKASATAA